MGLYTDSLENDIYTIYPEDDDYVEKLREVTNTFRSYGEAFNTFLLEHGYKGDISSVDEKYAFIHQKFKDANCKEPRNIKSWFDKGARIDNKSVPYIAFAFHLTMNEVTDFCRRISLTRGLDCHDMKSAIYYYCIQHELPYSKALELEKLVPVPKKLDVSLKSVEIQYTSTIRNELDHIQDLDQLVKYLAENESQFHYNNATAFKKLTAIWEEISRPNGLVAKEMALFPDIWQEGVNTDNVKVFGVTRNYSAWTIILHILGYTRNIETIAHTDRSLKDILDDSTMVHTLAANSFPNQQGINKILQGQHASDEQIRKLLILLLFYRFWIKLGIKRKNPMECYSAKGIEADACIDAINDVLTECNYPSLYYGNPYDWIFLYSIQSEEPINAFRDFMSIVEEEKADAFYAQEKYEQNVNQHQ